MYKILKAYLILAVLTACSVYQPNKNPDLLSDKADIYSSNSQENNTNYQAWYESFNNYELNGLIIEALQDNLSIKQSLAQIKEAIAIAKQSKSGLFPEVSFESAINQSYETRKLVQSNKNIGIGLDWNIDIFKGISSRYKSEELLINARQNDLKAIKLAITVQLANAYFGAVAANLRIDLLNQQIKTDKQLLDLLKLRFDNGVGTKVEVLQQQSRVIDSEALLPLAKNQLNIFENAIDVLLGKTPDSKNRVNKTESSLKFVKGLPNIGVPADLIIHRPDIASLKNELISADYEIASAIADRLPSITLSASYAYRDEIFFNGPISFISANFVQPLLDWGRRKAVVEQNKALYEEKLAEFTQSYLLAVQDVENALNAEKTIRENYQKQQKQIKILKKAVNEAKARFEKGVDDYQPALLSIQELRNVERNLVDAELNLINSRIALYSAIGGNVNIEDK